MNLLLVNDEILTLNMLKNNIHWTACNIDTLYTATSAKAAKRILEQQKIDILLLDIEMPYESGISLLSWARKTNIKAECIFLTCHANFQYAQDAISLGCSEYILLPASINQIEEVIRKVVSHILSQNSDSRMQEYGKQWLDSLNTELTKQQKDKKSPQDSVNEAISYIMQHLSSSSISVNEVASFCCLSPIYLNRIFKKVKGISISQFIIQEKMNLAKKLLETSDISATSIALQLGYNSYPYFSSTYKKVFGIVPSETKQKNTK